MLELWELGGRDDCRFSTFSWRARLALHHKGLAFSVHPVAVSDKAAIGFSGQRKVPIVKHDEHVITDSWAIALYLEQAFADRPTLFGGAVGETLTQVFNGWTDRELIPALIPYFMRDVLDCVNEADAVHLRGQVERALKKSLEELAAERDNTLPVFRRKLAPVRKTLEQKSFLGGPAPVPVVALENFENDLPLQVRELRHPAQHSPGFAGVADKYRRVAWTPGTDFGLHG